jgi:hypothetical protein
VAIPCGPRPSPLALRPGQHIVAAPMIAPACIMPVALYGSSLAASQIDVQKAVAVRAQGLNSARAPRPDEGAAAPAHAACGPWTLSGACSIHSTQVPLSGGILGPVSLPFRTGVPRASSHRALLGGSALSGSSAVDLFRSMVVWAPGEGRMVRARLSRRAAGGTGRPAPPPVSMRCRRLPSAAMCRRLISTGRHLVLLTCTICVAK